MTATETRIQLLSDNSILDKSCSLFALLLLFTLPIRDAFFVIESPVVTIGFVVGVIFGSVWLIRAVMHGQFQFSLKFHGIFFALTLWSGISILWAADIGQVISRTVSYFYILATLVALYDTYSRKNSVSPLLQAYVLGASILVISTLSVFFADPTANWRRLAGFGYNPNKMGTVVTLGVPLAYYLIRNQFGPVLLKIVNGLYIPSAILTVSLTGSRGSMVALSFILLGMLVDSLYSLGMRGKLYIFAGTLTGIWITVSMLPERTASYIMTIPELAVSVDLGSRERAWQSTMEVFMTRPLLGVGADNVSVISETGVSAHSLFFFMLGNHGLVGFGLFLLLIAYLCQMIFDEYMDTGSWLVFLLGWVMLNLFNDFGMVISFVLLNIIAIDGRQSIDM